MHLFFKKTEIAYPFKRTVFAFVDLYQLLDVNEREGVLSIKLWIFLSYYVEAVKWDPEQIGVHQIQVQYSL